MGRPSPLEHFVDDLQAGGRYVFAKDQARQAVPAAGKALDQALFRLGKKGRIVRVRSDFFVIVPLEYRSTGILPAAWFIHDLMAHQDLPYYVGVLSAAALHGAAHQRPREFQVVTSQALRSVEVKELRIAFLKNSRLSQVPTQERKVESGFLQVSTPEATALDLVIYVSHAGGLHNVATVLAELGEVVAATPLVEYAQRRLADERPNLQRLGYLLERVGADDLAEALHGALFTARPGSSSTRRRTSSLATMLAAIPDEVFWRTSTHGRRVPDFNGIFAWYLRQLYPDGLPESEQLLEEIAGGKTVNFSTFQRAVASEGRRRVPIVALRPDRPVRGSPVDARWALVVNEEVEPDL